MRYVNKAVTTLSTMVLFIFCVCYKAKSEELHNRPLQAYSVDNDTRVRRGLLQTLTLSIDTVTLNKDTNTTLEVKVAYSDKSTKDVTNQVQWIISPKDAVKIEGTTLTALKDGNITLQAKYQNRFSDKINLNIYWEVNGHRLPPEPDPVKNNATLLGIDVNNNGVRDDVERWIYKTYSHPIERGIFMQEAFRIQKQISNIDKAMENSKFSDKSLSCEYFLTKKYNWFKEKYEYIDLSEKVKVKQLNTIQRHIAYEKYNAKFNGMTFSGIILPNKENCFFDDNGNLKVQP